MPGSAHPFVVGFMTARAFIAHRLGGRVDVDRLARCVVVAIVAREVVLRVEVCATDDAVVLMCMCHWSLRVDTPKAAGGVPLSAQAALNQRSIRTRQHKEV